MIIGSMTTMPHRIQNCKAVINSILSTGIDWLEFNIPEKSLRTGELYEIPSWLTEMENIRIFRTPDYGPLTKILPTMQRHEGSTGWIITFDDDTLYRPNLVKLYTPFLTQQHVIGSCGLKLIDNFCSLVETNNEQCSILCGFAGIVYPASLYKTPDMEYFKEVIKNKECFQSDDLVLSNFAQRKGYTCFHIFKLGAIIKDQLYSGMDDPHGLCNTGGRTYDKIMAGIEYLRQKRLLSLTIFSYKKRYGIQGGKLRLG